MTKMQIYFWVNNLDVQRNQSSERETSVHCSDINLETKERRVVEIQKVIVLNI